MLDVVYGVGRHFYTHTLQCKSTDYNQHQRLIAARVNGVPIVRVGKEVYPKVRPSNEWLFFCQSRGHGTTATCNILLNFTFSFIHAPS